MGKPTAGYGTDGRPLEWRLQASVVKVLMQHPWHGRRFAFAGDQNAAKRTLSGAAIAKATGMMAGEPDMRFYLERGRIGLIEMKRKGNTLQDEQLARHATLRHLGFDKLETVTAETEADAVKQVMQILEGWLDEVD